MRSVIIALVATLALVSSSGASAGPDPRPHNRCYRVACPQFIRRCPRGEVWGKRHPSDCCNDACVKLR